MACRDFVLFLFLWICNVVLDINADCQGNPGICNWSPWESWSECSETCGGGTRRRHQEICCRRSHSSSREVCMKDCGHDMSYYYSYSYERQSCNNNCYNGGVFGGSSCRCSYTFKGKCCLKRKCAWNNHYCWPGVCYDELTRGCSCAPDFNKVQISSETSCQPSKTPSILTCNTVAVGPNGEKKRAIANGKSTACQYLTDMYGNFQLSSFQFDMSAEYTVSITGYTKPRFVQESNFGITDTTIDVIKIPVNGIRSTVSVHQQLVDSSASENAVRKQDNTGNIIVTSTSYNLVDGQALCLEFIALAGGYLKSKNLITHVVSEPVPYQKVRSTRKVCYRFDKTAPRHCKETGNCQYDPVQLPHRITRSTVSRVSFPGWSDPIPSGGTSIMASSIESYQITVNEVHPSPGKIKVDYLSNVYTKKVAVNETNMLLNLTSDKPRFYCITLEVKDTADNVRQARRFLLYDNTSFIETRDDKPFQIISASTETNFEWQTHHHEICLSWMDHFMNRFYFDNPLLNPIEAEPHGLVTGIYEQNSGVLPVSGTANVNGIVRFMISWNLNEGLLTSEITVPEFRNQSYCNDFKVTDGQTYTIVVRAIDIAGNSFKTNRTVHIDRSKPQINNIWLRKDGYKTLFVHHQTDLSTMQLYFEALDIHSGIRMVEWTFGIADTGIELSAGAISVGATNKKSCPDKALECYCPDVGVCEFFNYTVPMDKLVTINKHQGNHNRNYYFTIKVTNHAKVYNIEHVDILVDNSPPEIGIVYEGPENSNDIDYTSDDSFLVHWHGFIDHESGIKKYRIGLAARCLGQTELYNFTSIPDTEFYADVSYTESSLRIPANFTGKRYISIIALNNAMSPSEAICSDGITRDLSPPEIRNITLEFGKWSETIVCHEGRAWLLHSSLSKILLQNVSKCIDICNNSPQHNLLASTLPTNDIQNQDREISYFLCNKMRKYRSDTVIYLPTDHINLEWNVEETDSQIDDIFIGIGTDPSEVNSPSIDNYRSTARRNYFKHRHEGIGSDELFYIFLKIVNKASVERVTVFGPILIDETPPICSSVPTVFVLEQYIRVGWTNATFYDLEQKEQISSIYFEIGHESISVTPLLQWNLEISSPCPQFSGGCFKYPIRKLQTHDNDMGLPFYLRMHVCNNAGHVLTVTTETFKIPSRYPPGHAVVIDIDPDRKFYKEDNDVHFTKNTLCFTWTGFKHHENVKIEVGVGSSNTTSNIVPYSVLPHTANFHCVHSSNITFQQTYFALVKASCSGGETMSASNGVIVIDRNMLLKSLNVHVGKQCSTTDAITPVFRNSTAAVNKSITFSADIGRRYELFFHSSHTDSVNTNDGIILTNTPDNKSLSFVPFIKNPAIYISSNNGVINKETQIYIHKCPSALYVNKNDIVSAHWFYADNKNHGLKFETAIVNAKVTTVNNSQAHLIRYKTSSTLMKYTFIDVNIRSKECYKVAVKQCSIAQCIEPVFSKVFCEASSIEARNIYLSRLERYVDASCATITMEWDAFRTDNRILFYQWVVSLDDRANHILMEWNTIKAEYKDSYQVHSCIEIPVHLHSTMFGCIRAFDEAGNEGFACQGLDNMPTREYKPDKVYDFDSNTNAWKDIRKVLESSNIGNLYVVLHNNELDFGTKEAQVIGAMLYATERNVTWYLMSKNQIPETCEEKKNCITSETTNTGYVSFDGKFVSLNTFYYICAYSNETIIERELFSETLNKIKSCSNGFVLDSKYPRSGHVEAPNKDGFITNLKSIELIWGGFVDDIDAPNRSYVDSIRTYSYAIGSRPHGHDIRNFTNVGLRTSVVISDLYLPDGSLVYFTVTATDHAGNSATSVSNEYIVDTSSPTRGKIQTASYDEYNENTLYITSDEIEILLSDFKDDESGIDYFELWLGSKPYLMDILPKSNYRGVTIDLFLIGSSIKDGYTYYIAAKAFNRAGLSSDIAVLKFIADRTPPTGGHVLDGLWKNEKDDDYQTDLSHISARWKGFTDSHSGIAYYRTGLGTNAYLDDIKPFLNVGLVEDITWHSLFLTGQKYYTTVDACNNAGLCVTRTSDGIVIDNSPPIQGRVQIGSDELHRKFQSHTSSVHVTWAGFDDPQSGIDRYDMCIGTKPESCDVLPNMNCLLQSNVIKTGLNLPPKKDFYATVTAYNRVHLNVSQTSDSFYVDASPPIMSIKPTFRFVNNNFFGKKGQWDKSFVKIFWKFDDDESPIAYHDVTLVTHHEGHTPVEHVKLGPENELTISLDGKSWLHDGDSYFASITSCNLAGLCSSEKSDDLKIDSSPPHLGGFKPPMVWENLNSSLGERKSNVTLSWYGFHDQESGVARYFITASKTYSGNELTDGVSTVNVDSSDIENTHSLLLNNFLERDDTLFLTIWAENSVGLNSSLARVSVTVLSSSSTLDYANLKGSLELEKHSCDIQYCNKDCTCAVVGRPCVEVETNSSCKEVNESHFIPDIDVFNGMYEMSPNITASSACLAGSWKVGDNQGYKNITRFEWSMGIQDQPVGEGVFNLKNERPWNDVGLQKHIVHCLHVNKSLIAGESYVIYVRAWFSRNTFAVYRSAPITIDHTAPSIRRGRSVFDSNELCNADFDVIDWEDKITACWADVFLEQQGRIVYYIISLGSYPFGDDTFSRKHVGLNTSITLANISLSQGTKYFFSVTAYNTVGLHTSVLSDGFIIDMGVPVSGVVFNTLFYRNTAYHSSASSIGISWHGFQDAISGIQHYYAALSNMPFTDQSMNTTNTGLLTHFVFKDLALENGKTYYGLIKAVDKVGHVSTLAVSKGITIDTTPPVGYRCVKYSEIGQMSKDTSESDEKENLLMYLQYTSSSQKLYKIIGNILSPDDHRVRIKIRLGRMHMYLPTAKDHNQGYNFEHSFFGQNTGLQNISLKLENDDQRYLMVNTRLFECSQIIEDSNAAVQLKQMSRSMIAIHLLVKDEDSSLNKIQLGAGTTVDGFQIKPLSDFYHFHNKLLIKANVPHGTQVFVTAIAENKAGLSSLFRSAPITMDHTPPVANNLAGGLQNVQVNKSGFVEVHTIGQATWDVTDEESGILQCYCSIGNRPGLFDVHSAWIAQTLTSCTSNEIQLSHGQHIYLNLKCVNNIELSTTTFTEALVASIEKSDTHNAVMAFVPQNEESSEYISSFRQRFPVQSNHTCLELKWEGFEDLSGIDHFEYRLTQSGHAFSTDWTKTYRDLVEVSNVDIESGDITAEVRAINTGSFVSESVNASILVERHAPILTGRKAKMKRRGNLLDINWADVFQTVEGIPLSYSLIVGSRRGYADILDMNYITSTKYDVYIPDSTLITQDLKEVFVRIACIYVTGLRTSYNTIYMM